MLFAFLLCSWEKQVDVEKAMFFLLKSKKRKQEKEERQQSRKNCRRESPRKKWTKEIVIFILSLLHRFPYLLYLLGEDIIFFLFALLNQNLMILFRVCLCKPLFCCVDVCNSANWKTAGIVRNKEMAVTTRQFIFYHNILAYYFNGVHDPSSSHILFCRWVFFDENRCAPSPDAISRVVDLIAEQCSTAVIAFCDSEVFISYVPIQAKRSDQAFWAFERSLRWSLR